MQTSPAIGLWDLMHVVYMAA